MSLYKAFLTCLLGLVFIALLQTLLTKSTKNATKTAKEGNIIRSSPYDGLTDPIILNTTICSNRCYGDCLYYLTPIGKCYNGQNMFPDDGDDDNPFGEQDIMDITVSSKQVCGAPGIQRIFYKSTDGSCSGGASDDFDDLPLNKCIGPYGPPRPWGIMKLA